MSVRHAACTAGFLAMALVSTPGHAEPQPPKTEVPAASAFNRVADSLARAFGQAALRGVLVAGGPLVSDTPAPRGSDLASAILMQIKGRLGPHARAWLEPSPLAAARAAVREEAVLLFFRIEIAAGKLRLTGDAYPGRRTAWARIRDPEPGPFAHAFAEATIDAEVRSFLAPVPLTAANVIRAKNFEGDIVALACADLDEDGAPEIVAMGRRRVSVVRLRSGRVVPYTSRAWPDLVPVAPSPLREPIGFVTVASSEVTGRPVAIDVGLTDRSKSVRLDGSLQVTALFPGLSIPDGASSTCAHLAGLLIAGPLAPCSPADGPPTQRALAGKFDAFTSARLIAPSGKPYIVWGGREHGVLEVRDDAGHAIVIEGAGAQIAVGDLDQDGNPEVLTSNDTDNPLDDAVTIRSWTRTARPPSVPLKEVARLPAAAGVRALAVCPPDGPGPAPFVVATSDELWVGR